MKKQSEGNIIRYAAAYKAYNMMCVYKDRLQRPSLSTMGVPPDLHPAGRLDLDSEGLVLLTNDGDVQHRVTHPDFQHPKTYLVLVLGCPDADALSQLRNGIQLSDFYTRPADIEIFPGAPALAEFPGRLPRPEKTTWLRMVLYEGKNRQIKRMTAAVGHSTVRLVRVAVGPVALPADLEPGQWRDLNLMERKILLDWVWHGSAPRTRKPAVHSDPQKKRGTVRP